MMHRSSSRIARGALWASVLMIGHSLVGCEGDTAGPAPSGHVSQFWALRFNHHAITLATIAPYDTLTLVATPRTATGEIIPTSDTVIYTSNDTSVEVSSTGKIKAHTIADVTTNVQIVATMQLGGIHGITLADTAWVNVVSQPSPDAVPVVETFSLQQPDSDVVTILNYSNFQAVVLDTAGQPIPWVQVYYYTPPNEVLRYDNNYGGGTVASGVGHAVLHADAVIYGRAVQDSLRVTQGYQIHTQMDIMVTGSPGHLVPTGFPVDTVFLGLGGVVIWHNMLTGLANDSMDIEFSGPAPTQPMVRPETLYYYDPLFDNGNGASRYLVIAPDGGGDVAPFVALPSLVADDSTGTSAKGRRFTVPGVYTYHSRFFPGIGVINVISNADVP